MEFKTLIFALFALFVFHLSTAFGSCLHWKKRMEKYGSLVNCEYYVTSESEYKDFFAFDELANQTDNNILQIHFFTLTQNALKFMLSEKNNSDSFNALKLVNQRNSGESELTSGSVGMIPDYSDYGQYRRYSTTTPRTTTPVIEPKTNSNLGENYEFVFGDEPPNEVESFVRKGSNRLKTLMTPGIIRKNEPNEILIEIFTGGKIRVTINGNDRIELRGHNFDAVKYISFLSPIDRMLTEFFYNCKN